MTTTTQLDPVQMIALSKSLKEKAVKEARSLVGPGTYKIDETVRITGSMTVGEDYTSAPTVNVPHQLALAIALRKAGIQRENIVALLMEAITMDRESDDYKQLEAEMAEYTEMVKEAVAATLPRNPCKGQVRAALTVELVESEEK